MGLLSAKCCRYIDFGRRCRNSPRNSMSELWTCRSAGVAGRFRRRVHRRGAPGVWLFFAGLRNTNLWIPQQRCGTERSTKFCYSCCGYEGNDVLRLRRSSASQSCYFRQVEVLLYHRLKISDYFHVSILGRIVFPKRYLSGCVNVYRVWVHVRG